MTLTEVLMAVFIMAITMEGFALLYMRSLRSNAFILEEGMTVFAVSRAVNSMVSDLRKIRQSDGGAYPILLGSDSELTVFLDIDSDGATEKVRYFLDGSDMKRGVSDPITDTAPVTYPDGDDSVSIIATRIVNTENQPVFYYYNENYPGDQVNNPLVTPVSVGDVRLVKIHLLMNIDPARAPDNVNIQSFVQLRNL